MQIPCNHRARRSRLARLGARIRALDQPGQREAPFMRCLRCQQENPPGSNFCLGCGARLGLTCALCGAVLVAGTRFCNKCGISLAPRARESRFASPESYTPKHLAERILTSKAALEGERKHVTVLFVDVKGSMELGRSRSTRRNGTGSSTVSSRSSPKACIASRAR